ncbi:MAG: LpqB family beta-propeller domain-containing protein [Cryobacterium sp.]|uniref:LpqB family beta-propeller domain-containing protein n=1 Tax=unclassified Cryobacterium TaxID=2649013 RepID=UPI0018CACCC4|nr:MULTISPECIES: LpqB family beta-propeller domain-containing protein [unclassified Cryobacterium]MCY7404934.1 LpqB family beta-propeller domain-containing protein [Cryobacterium sp.]
MTSRRSLGRTMRDGTRRVIWALVIAISLAIGVGGCTGIPRDGAVHAGNDIAPDDNPAPVFLPALPQKDASTDSILRGFIDASSSPENNYDIARQFLAPAFRTSWDPTAGVTVDNGFGRTLTVIDDGATLVAVTPIAEVDQTGEYREVDASPVPLRYEFQQIGGQWRISAAPNGTVIDENTFNDVFSAQPVYFYDPGFRFLVPDLRWFPRGASAPTKLVNAVLNGPSAWLNGAVATAFPEGSKLTADAVQVVGRQAMVDLNSEALNADRQTLQRMKAQLAASLPTGLTVDITIDQNSLAIDDLQSGAPLIDPRVDARALVLLGGEFGFLAATGQSVTPLDGLSDTIAQLAPTAVTLASGQRSAAVLGNDGVYLVRAGGKPERLDSRAGLLAPSIDNDRFVWSVPANDPSALVVYSPAGEATVLPTPWPEATSITALKISRDGARLIALLGTGSETRFVVASITRTGAAPTGIGAPVLLASGGGVGLDATWIDELTVASLSALPSGEARIVAQHIGGVSSILESPASSRFIVGSNSVRALRALTDTGSLDVQRGAGWQTRIDDVALLATQQGLGG